MNVTHIWCYVLLMAISPAATIAQTARHDGQHDFDFEIGTWKTHLRRRLNPLTG